MSDLISRADVLSELYLDHEDVIYIDKLETAKRIRAIPSAQTWIPCSERLPEAEDMHKAPKHRYLCFCSAYGCSKICVCARLDGAISSFWDWYGVPFKDTEVLAWMPLPEPYKEEQE